MLNKNKKLSHKEIKVLHSEKEYKILGAITNKIVHNVKQGLEYIIKTDFQLIMMSNASYSPPKSPLGDLGVNNWKSMANTHR